MAIEISARFYFDDVDTPMAGPEQRLVAMARSFSAWSRAAPTFQGWRLQRDAPHLTVAAMAESLSVEQLSKEVGGRSAANVSLSTQSSFRCWRFEPNHAPEHGSVPVLLSAWGDEWTTKNHADPRIGGQAELGIRTSGPFFCLPPGSNHPLRAAVDEAVADNLDAFTQLLFLLIEALAPRSVKVYTDAGLYLPFNAHWLYLRDESVILDDLELIAQLWQRGLPTHGVSPLCSVQPGQWPQVFTSWRTPEQCAELQHELATLLPPSQTPTTLAVQEALQSGRFDTYPMPRGATVLDYPYFMNAFVARFYLEVLKAALVESGSRHR